MGSSEEGREMEIVGESVKRTDFLVNEEVELGPAGRVVDARIKSLAREGSLGDVRVWELEGGWPWNWEWRSLYWDSRRW